MSFHAIQETIQEFANEGRLRVERYDTLHIAIFFNEAGEEMGRACGSLEGTPCEEMAPVRWQHEEGNGFVTICLLLGELPMGDAFTHLELHETAPFEITMRCGCVQDFYTTQEWEGFSLAPLLSHPEFQFLPRVDECDTPYSCTSSYDW